MRTIDADALEARMYHDAFETDTDMQRWDSGCWIRYKMFEKAIVEAPTIEPERKTGHWIPERRELEYTLRCSECGYTYTPGGLEDGTLDQADIHHYCPLCGTKMDRW